MDDLNSGWLLDDTNTRRNRLLKALGKHRYFLCMAADVYRPSSKRHSFLQWKYQNDISSQERSIYLKTRGKKKTFVVSFRGAARFHDLKSIYKLIKGSFGQSKRFKRDLEFVTSLKKKHPKASIILVGHSMGGRLASDIGERLNLKAITFNEARGLGKVDKKSFIQRYRTRTDLVSVFGTVGGSYKQLPGYGHEIRNIQRLVCYKKK